jgi:hypothetical protein
MTDEATRGLREARIANAADSTAEVTLYQIVDRTEQDRVIAAIQTL